MRKGRLVTTACSRDLACWVVPTAKLSPSVPDLGQFWVSRTWPWPTFVGRQGALEVKCPLRVGSWRLRPDGDVDQFACHLGACTSVRIWQRCPREGDRWAGLVLPEGPRSKGSPGLRLGLEPGRVA